MAVASSLRENEGENVSSIVIPLKILPGPQESLWIEIGRHQWKESFSLMTELKW